MILNSLNILNYRNIREGRLEFSPKLNCLVGLNGQGKTNILDAIYLLSFTKSALTAIDSQNITHGEDLAMVQGVYNDGMSREQGSLNEGMMEVSCGLKRGVKKQFRLGKKDYKRLIDHIGLIPLVMVSPRDERLIEDGSDERRRFMDVVIAQQDRHYLECLTAYNALLKQRNLLLKQIADRGEALSANDESLLEVFDAQMVPHAEYIYKARKGFIEAFIPVFQYIYNRIADGKEQMSLRYISQLNDRDLMSAMARTRQRDLILGWTSQGVHKDDLEMQLGDYPLKTVGSQGQQRTYVLSMKLAQALYLNKPILLLDDIFDKLDRERVARIIALVQEDSFGQIFITDTDRQHLTQLLSGDASAKIFQVEDGIIK